MKMFDVIRWLEGLKVSLGGPGKWFHNHPAHGKREVGFAEMSDKHLENTIAMLERLDDAIFVAWNAIQDKRYGLELHMKRRREKRQRAEEHQGRVDNPWAEALEAFGLGWYQANMRDIAAMRQEEAQRIIVEHECPGVGFCAYYADSPSVKAWSMSREGAVLLLVGREGEKR